MNLFCPLFNPTMHHICNILLCEFVFLCCCCYWFFINHHPWNRHGSFTLCIDNEALVQIWMQPNPKRCSQPVCVGCMTHMSNAQQKPHKSCLFGTNHSWSGEMWMTTTPVPSTLPPSLPLLSSLPTPYPSKQLTNPGITDDKPVTPLPSNNFWMRAATFQIMWSIFSPNPGSVTSECHISSCLYLEQVLDRILILSFQYFSNHGSSLPSFYPNPGSVMWLVSVTFIFACL